jgi:hypothetical protein
MHVSRYSCRRTTKFVLFLRHQSLEVRKRWKIFPCSAACSAGGVRTERSSRSSRLSETTIDDSDDATTATNVKATTATKMMGVAKFGTFYRFLYLATPLT